MLWRPRLTECSGDCKYVVYKTDIYLAGNVTVEMLCVILKPPIVHILGNGTAFEWHSVKTKWHIFLEVKDEDDKIRKDWGLKPYFIIKEML